ncbi:MAG: translation elongation factor 4, partial [Clostridiales bacterium]|nr:translation elongation factor 4 [Clostridiales bacterium]
MKYPKEHIRNFCIIAHIDHGKSTLADRLMEFTNQVASRDMHDQLLDSMDLERERGITIKSRAVRMVYKADDGIEYLLNLIDTPGHVDFTYEVSRSLAACEGALLIVDASQGIEAQTLANVYLAIDNNLEVIPVINKIDLPSADVENTRQEIEDIIGIPADEAPAISAKEGTNIHDVLESIVKLLPPPVADDSKPCKALIFDSFYDNYKGAICYVRMFEGSAQKGMIIEMMATGATFEVTEVGVFTPENLPVDVLRAGEVGYIAASIKEISQTKVGDTITDSKNRTDTPLPGYKDVQPMVFCGIYPADGAYYTDLKDALERLKLNDASLIYEPETSAALGFGFRCGFLGLLHMEIIAERLEREHDLDLVTTAPSVIYKIVMETGEEIVIDNPSNLPNLSLVDHMLEPIANAHVISPPEFVGTIMELCQEKRGIFVDMQYLDKTRVQINYLLPLNEIIYDFFDSLKSRTRGYASLDYDIKEYVKSDLV